MDLNLQPNPYLDNLESDFPKKRIANIFYLILHWDIDENMLRVSLKIEENKNVSSQKIIIMIESVAESFFNLKYFIFLKKKKKNFRNFLAKNCSNFFPMFKNDNNTSLLQLWKVTKNYAAKSNDSFNLTYPGFCFFSYKNV